MFVPCRFSPYREGYSYFCIKTSSVIEVSKYSLHPMAVISDYAALNGMFYLRKEP